MLNGEELHNAGRKVGVVGLGYVGLPVAVAFARAGALTIAFDIDQRRVNELKRYFDRTRETTEAELRAVDIRVSSDEADLRDADFFIVGVPTPIDAANRPDMSMVLAASRTVAKALKKREISSFMSRQFIPVPLRKSAFRRWSVFRGSKTE